MTTNGQRVSVRGYKNVLKLTVAMVEYTKIH